MKTPNPPVVSRLAPTPSGFLHAGNAFSFVFTWLWVRKSGGVLRLRIDDLDSDRARPEYTADVFETLEWLGLDWDAGPQSPDDFGQNFSQRFRLDSYHGLLAELRQTGLVYACDCSRAKSQSLAVNGLYAGTCRNKHLPLNAPNVAWRIRVPEDVRVMPNAIRRAATDGPRYRVAELMGDFVIRRKDGIPAYQVASLADDLRYDTNLIVRGADLLPSTAAQLYLAQLLDKQQFTEIIFYHHPLLLDAAGHKLSKSAGSASIRALRQPATAGGVSPSPAILFQNAARWLGLPAEGVFTAHDLLRRFGFQLPGNNLPS